MLSQTTGAYTYHSHVVLVCLAEEEEEGGEGEEREEDGFSSEGCSNSWKAVPKQLLISEYETTSSDCSSLEERHTGSLLLTSSLEQQTDKQRIG